MSNGVNFRKMAVDLRQELNAEHALRLEAELELRLYKELHANVQAHFAESERQVGELRDLLRSMTLDYRDAISNGYDRIIFLGGDCDSPKKMLADNPSYAKSLAFLNTTSTEGKGHE